MGFVDDHVTVGPRPVAGSAFRRGLALALIVAAPIVGQIPLGLAVCLVGLGLVERDGIVVMGGLVIGLFGVAINAGFAYAVIAGILSLLNVW